MLIPVVIGIAAKSGFSRSRLLLPIVFAAAMGGNLSLIDVPGNMIAHAALVEQGLSFGFFEYGLIGLPILLVGVLFIGTIGFPLLPNHKVGEMAADNADRVTATVPQWKKNASLIVLILTILCMVFEKQIGILLPILFPFFP